MIRRATMEDNEFIVEQYREFYNDIGHVLLDWPSDEECGRIVSRMVRNCITLIVEDENSQPRGFIVLVYTDQLLQPGKKALAEQTIWVCKDARGQGYGKELMDGALAVAREIEDVSLVTVTIDPSSQLTYNNMKDAGFIATGMQYARRVKWQ